MMIGFNSLPDSFFVQPAGRVGTGGADLSALFMDLVDRHLHEFSRHPLAAELIADVGVVDGVDAGLCLREGDLRQDLAVIIFAFDTVGESGEFNFYLLFMMADGKAFSANPCS